MGNAKEEKVVMFDSPEAARRVEQWGWKSRDGIFYPGDNPSSEHGARWSGCTHQTCECGNTYVKGHVRCDSCQSKKDTDEYLALPIEEWDGEGPVCTYKDDRFFFDEESLLEWMSDLEFDAKEMGEGRPTVQLVKCESRGLSIVDEDHWCDELPEEGELPDDIAVALDQLNKVINDSTYKVWWPGKVRIDVDALWKELDDREAEEIDKASEGIQ
jgi:hypothetical protein